jgi:hypothetical protein
VKLVQREPGPVAITKGISSLIAGLNARTGARWQVVSDPTQSRQDGKAS